MNVPLKIKLAACFALVSACVIAFIFVFARFSLDTSFQRYLINRQDSRISDVKHALEQSNVAAGGWDNSSVESIGISALEQGLILILRDADGNTIWDATNHNSGMCSAMIEHMAENMSRQYPAITGGYATQFLPLYAESGESAELEVGYYGPFYLTSDETLFIGAVNRALLLGSLVALLLSLTAGTWLANRIAAPLAEVVRVSKKIADGDYRARGDAKDSTKEIQELMQTINELAQILSEQQNLRKRLTQDVEHELKTPMALLQGHMEAIMDGIWQPTPERIKSCHDEIIRINNLIGDLGTLARCEEGGFAVTRQEIDLGEVINAVVTNLERGFADKGVILEACKISFSVNTDRDKLTQILVNLLSNSLKYTPSGGHVAVEARDFADRFEISVSDDGIGIPREELQLVFERFYRTDLSRARKTGGAGIGLAIVQALVTALGGSISVKSTQNTQTVFTLCIVK
ncbi:MAG: HAMP domain-containing protein [Synergistaceae bacterium]|nr:HAMP domain-containing protein [Synergistaceae bacterium]